MREEVYVMEILSRKVVLEPDGVRADSLLTPAVVRTTEGVAMLVRGDMEGRSNIYLATGDGETFTLGDLVFEDAEDPRISVLDGKYVLTFSRLAPNGTPRLYLATSADLRTWDTPRKLFDSWSKEGVLLKLGDKYLLMAEREPYGHIVLHESDDLRSWRVLGVIVDRGGARGVEPGFVAETDDSLLLFLNQVDYADVGTVCLAKLPKDNIWFGGPRTEVLRPEQHWEVTPFPYLYAGGGYLDDEGNVHIYYSAADKVIGKAVVRL